MLKIKVFIISIMSCLCTHVLSQLITNVNYKLIGDKIYVTYDLNAEPRTQYRIELKFIDNSGNELIPVNVDGDIGLVKGGTKKIITCALSEKIQSMEDIYDAVLVVKDKIKANHSILYNANLLLTYVGIKYAYLGDFGGYLSASSNLGGIHFSEDTNDYHMLTVGITARIYNKYYPYLGGGLEITRSEPIVEGGIIMNFRGLVIDLGGGSEFYYWRTTANDEPIEKLSALPFFKIGIGVGF